MLSYRGKAEGGDGNAVEWHFVFQFDGAYLLSLNSNEEHEFISQWLTKHDMNR